MNILRLMNLSKEERGDAITLINTCGAGKHSIADDTSIDFFTPNYLSECIDLALEECTIEAARPRLLRLKERVDTHQAQKEAEFAAYRASLKTGKQVSA